MLLFIVAVQCCCSMLLFNVAVCQLEANIEVLTKSKEDRVSEVPYGCPYTALTRVADSHSD